MKLIVAAVSIFVSVAVADYATQTDWSGGGGTWGPVIDWGNEFYVNTNTECYNDPSNIILEKTMSLVPMEHTVDGAFDGAYSVCSADFNGDGYMDVLGAATGADDITWWENVNGSGTLWTEHTVDGSFDEACSVYSADVNGDGYMDVLGAATGADDITWWENVDGSGTSWTEHTIDGTFDCSRSVFSADINGDGYVDVLGAAMIADDITWWENEGGSGTSWTEHTVDGAFDGAVCVYSADVNDDGYMDILGAAADADDIAWWENSDTSPGTYWTEHTVDGAYDYAFSVYSTDVNGDGYMDVLGAAVIADDITWWENVDGSGTSWTEHTVDGNFDCAYSVCSADVNGDGYMDVIGAAGGVANAIIWWENVDGSGTSWTEHAVDGAYEGAFYVRLADVNGDGYLDVLGAANADYITWWDLREFFSDGSLESSVLDVQESPDWQALDWTCTEPSGTSVALQVRASDNSSNMGAWSDTLIAPCDLSGIVTDQDRYFQYRAILNTTNSYATPVLQDVTVDWQPFTGMQEESTEGVTSFALYGALPNPGLGDATLLFSLAFDSWVELTVYDLTGRAIHTTSGDFCSGAHEVLVGDLDCGVYLIRMASGEFTDTRCFVVIE